MLRGQKMPEYIKKKISRAHLGMKKPWAKPPHFSGEKSSRWMGEMGTYSTIHNWIRKNFVTENRCEFCNTEESKRFEWARLNNELSRERKDWARLCASCHRKLDRVGYKSWETRRRKYGK